MGVYFDNLCEAMSLVAKQPNAVIMGQAVLYPGTAMYNTLKHLPEDVRLEMPVAEDMQLGMATGMALGGHTVLSVYPRWNFLLLATNQLVLHLDKLCDYSGGGYKPRVLIRTAVASPTPLDPGPQHLGDFSNPYDMMLKNVRVRRLESAENIVNEYQFALEREYSTILVEYMHLYGT